MPLASDTTMSPGASGPLRNLVTAATAIPLMLRSGGGLLVEMTDGTSGFNSSYREGVGFYYDLVKATVDRIVKSLAAELSDQAVTALGVTPGWLRSENMLEKFGVGETSWRDACRKVPGFAISESPTYVARGVAALAGDEDASRFTGHVLTSRQLADTYDLTDTDGSRPDCWGYIDGYGIEEQDGQGVDQFR
jgi:NAD(P)-dependent dehydrogenase (short-subunit alcohol dehydrogenase family)